MTTFSCVFFSVSYVCLISPDEEVDDLRGDVLEEGVEQVQHGGPEELRAEAEDERRQDGELGLRLLRLLLPVPVPDGDHVGRPGIEHFLKTFSVSAVFSLPVFWSECPEILLSQSPPPASPGEAVEPREKHFGGERGSGLRGEVLHLLLQLNVLRLRIARDERIYYGAPLCHKERHSERQEMINYQNLSIIMN